jgi:GNAT superfamily N-acetyltransferase
VIQAWRSVIYNYREGGIGQIGRKLLRRVSQWLRSDAAWLVYRMDGDPRPTPALALSCSHLSFEELRDLGYFKALSFPEGIQSRLAFGAVCNGFFLNGELANIAWTSEGYLEIEAGVVVRERDCVGIFDCFTMPSHRGKGIYTDTLIRLTGEIHSKGATALIAVDPDNIPSIRGIEKAGFRPLYRLERVCRFGRSVLRRS